MSHARKQKNLSRKPHRRKYLPQEFSSSSALSLLLLLMMIKNFSNFPLHIFLLTKTFFHPIYSLSPLSTLLLPKRTQTIYIYLSAKQKKKNEWKINKFLSTKMIQWTCDIYIYLINHDKLIFFWKTIACLSNLKEKTNWKVLQKNTTFKNIYNVENFILFVKLELQWSLSIPKCVCVWTTWQKSNFLLKLYVLTKIKHFVLASYLQDTGKIWSWKFFPHFRYRLWLFWYVKEEKTNVRKFL